MDRLLPLYGVDPEALTQEERDAFDAALFPEDVVIAAGRWDPSLHPRDHHGRFISVGDLVHFFMGTEEKTGTVTGIEDGRVAVDTVDRGTVRLRPDQIRESVSVRALLRGDTVGTKSNLTLHTPSPPFFHATDADLSPGDILTPAHDRGFTGKWADLPDYNASKVYLYDTNAGEYDAEDWGKNIYEVEPIGPVDPDPEYHPEQWDAPEDDPAFGSWVTDNARVVRKVSSDEVGTKSNIAISDFEFRMGDDGLAHLTPHGHATALDGHQTTKPAPTDGSVPPCPRCLDIASHQIADYEAGIVPEQPEALKQLARLADQVGAKSGIDLEDIDGEPEVVGELLPSIKGKPEYEAPATYSEEERVVLSGWRGDKVVISAVDEDELPLEVPIEAQRAYASVQDEVDALAGNQTYKGRPEKRSITLRGIDLLPTSSDSPAPNGAVGMYFGTRGEKAKEIEMALYEEDTHWVREQSELAHTFVHESAHAHFAEDDDANIDQYRPLLDALTLDMSGTAWEYGTTAGIQEFAPDLIAYSVVYPDIVAVQGMLHPEWDPAEIDRLVGGDLDQPDFHKVRDAAADMTGDEVGTKAALRLPAGVDVNQREGEPWPGVVKRAMKDEVGTEAHISTDGGTVEGMETPDQDPNVTTHNIKAIHLGELQARVDKLNKRAAKLNVEPMTLEIGTPEKREIYEKIVSADGVVTGSYPTGRYETWVDVTLTGTTPQLPGGWAFLGAIEHHHAGGDLNLVHGDDPRLAKYRTAEPECEHCHLARRRAHTVILEGPDGNLAQVGRACVKDYLGYHTRPDAWLAWADEVRDIADFDDERGFSSAPTFETNDALATVAAAVRVNGFTPKSAGEDNVPTAAIVAELLNPTRRRKELTSAQELADRVTVTPADTDKAAEIREWAAKIPADTDNNYLGNLHVILSKTFLDGKDLGIVSSSVSAADRDKERGAKFRWTKVDGEFVVKGPDADVGDIITINKADGSTVEAKVTAVVDPGVYKVEKIDALPKAGHWGEVGQRAEFIGRVTNVKAFDGDYGISYLVKLETPEGHVLTTFSSGSFGQDAEIGKVVRAKGTVKEHGEYNGEPETKLARVTAIDWEADFATPEPKAKKTRAKKAKATAPLKDFYEANPELQAVIVDNLDIPEVGALHREIQHNADGSMGLPFGSTESLKQGEYDRVLLDVATAALFKNDRIAAATILRDLTINPNEQADHQRRTGQRYRGPKAGDEVGGTSAIRFSYQPATDEEGDLVDDEYTVTVKGQPVGVIKRDTSIPDRTFGAWRHGGKDFETRAQAADYVHQKWLASQDTGDEVGGSSSIALDVPVRADLTFLHAHQSDADGHPVLVEYDTPTGPRAEWESDFGDTVGIVLDEPGNQSGIAVNAPRSELVAWSAEHPTEGAILDHLDEAYLASVLDTWGKWNPMANALPSASYDPATGDAGLNEIAQDLFDQDIITYTEALGIRDRLQVAPLLEFEDYSGVPSNALSNNAATVWLSWSGSKGIRRAAIDMTGKFTPDADPQIDSNRDVLAEETMREYGWPEGYDPHDPKVIAEERKAFNTYAKTMLDTLARGAEPDESLQRSIATGDLYRGQAMTPEQIVKLRPGKKVDLPIVALTDREDKAQQFAWNRLKRETLYTRESIDPSLLGPEDDVDPGDIEVERERDINAPVILKVVGDTPYITSSGLIGQADWHWMVGKPDHTKDWEDIDGNRHGGQTMVPAGMEVVSGGQFEVVSNDGSTITLRHLGVYDSNGNLIPDGGEDEVGSKAAISLDKDAGKYPTEVAHDIKLYELMEEQYKAWDEVDRQRGYLLSAATAARVQGGGRVEVRPLNGGPRTFSTLDDLPEGTLFYQAKTQRGDDPDEGYWVKDESATWNHRRRATDADALKVLPEDDKRVVTLNEALAKSQAAREAINAHEATYNGWNRYFLVPDGHVHRWTNCSTCYPTTRFAPLPVLSGHNDGEAVDMLGETLCTVCFPDAPVDARGKAKKITRAQVKKILDANKPPEVVPEKIEILAPKKPRQRKENVVTLTPGEWDFLKKLRTEGPFIETWWVPSAEDGGKGTKERPPVSPYGMERNNLITVKDYEAVDPDWVYDPTYEYGFEGVDPGEQYLRDKGVDKISGKIYEAVPWDANDPRQVGPGGDEAGAKSGINTRVRVPIMEQYPEYRQPLHTAFSEPGTPGNDTHITRSDKGMIPISVVTNMPGAEGEMPGAHRNRKGEQWEEFKANIAENGLQNPLFIMVDSKGTRLSEGNHRRDAAVELGLPEVPVEIRYFGHTEREHEVYPPDPDVVGAKSGINLTDYPDAVPASTLSSEAFVKRDAISVPWDEVRQQYIADAHASGLYDEVAANGVRVPVQIFVPKDGPPEVSTGHHRIAVAEDLGIDVPVRWYGPGYTEATGQKWSMDPKEFKALEVGAKSGISTRHRLDGLKPEGATRQLSDRQVQARARQVINSVGEYLGKDLSHVEVDIGMDEFDGEARWIGTSPVTGNTVNAMLLNPRTVVRDLRDPEIGPLDFRKISHEAMHAGSGSEYTYPGITHDIEEGGAEILSLDHWFREGPPADPRDAAMGDTAKGEPRWIEGPESILRQSVYKKEVAEVITRAASKVGWDRDAILAEVKDIFASDNRNPWKGETDPDFAPPPGVDPADPDGLIRWLLLPGEEAVAAAAVWSPDLHPRDQNGRWIDVGDLVRFFIGGSEDSGSIKSVKGDRVTVTTRRGDVVIRPRQIAESVNVRATLHPDEVGARSGIDAEEYRGQHQPNDEGPPAYNLAQDDFMPADVYDHPDWYVGDPGSQASRETIAVLRRVRGNPDATVTIYRGAPPDAEEINPGDWVTLSPTYAKEHGYDAVDPNKDWPVISREVPVNEVRFAGDDLNEFGWWPDEVGAESGISTDDPQSTIQSQADTIAERFPGTTPVEVRFKDNLITDLHHFAGKSNDTIDIDSSATDPEVMAQREKDFKGLMIDPSLAGVVTHEYGHILDGRLLRERPDLAQRWDDYLNEPLTNSLGNLPRIQNGLEAPSPYGSDNRYEFAAEAFADYIKNGDNASPAGQFFGALVEEAFGPEASP
jgi:hypothetical protein